MKSRVGIFWRCELKIHAFAKNSWIPADRGGSYVSRMEAVHVRNAVRLRELNRRTITCVPSLRRSVFRVGMPGTWKTGSPCTKVSPNATVLQWLDDPVDCVSGRGSSPNWNVY